MMNSSKFWSPMLAYSIDKPFDSPHYIFEPKWDGFRCIGYLEPKQPRLFSRNGKELTAFFPELANLHQLLSGKTAILDGEIVALVGGSPCFQALLERTRNPKLPQTLPHIPIVYMVFDILMWNDTNLISLPLWQRKEYLRAAISESDHCVLTRYVHEHGIALYDAVKEQHMEGIIAKQLSSRYMPGKRSRSWLKCKVIRSVDACIVGFTPKGNSLVSLALAVYKDSGSVLFYIGHVGTGFSEEEAYTMRQFFHRFCCSQTDLTIQNVTNTTPHTQWIYPQVVCQVNFLTLTPNNKLRHPSFVAIRPDKRPDECTWEQLQ